MIIHPALRIQSISPWSWIRFSKFRFHIRIYILTFQEFFSYNFSFSKLTQNVDLKIISFKNRTFLIHFLKVKLKKKVCSLFFSSFFSGFRPKKIFFLITLIYMEILVFKFELPISNNKENKMFALPLILPWQKNIFFYFLE